MRIGGLASGMDIDKLVNDLMKAEQIPLDKLKQEKQTLEWKRDQYREMNTLFLDFRSELTNMKLTHNYRVRTTTTTDEAKVTATANNTASLATYNIESVSQLASAATLLNGGKISTGTEKIDADVGIYSQNSKFVNPNGTFSWKQGIVESKDIFVSEDGQPISLESAIYDPSTVSIKVNGKGLEVITDSTATLTEGQVYLDTTTGDLDFFGELEKDTIVEAEFVVENKTETKTVSDTLESWQLEHGSVYVNDFSLDVTIGSTTKTYTIDSASGNANEYNLVNGTDVLGTINTETGVITFEPELAKDTKLEVEYKQNYTSFELGAYTSEGETYEKFILTGNQSLNSVINEVNASEVGLTMFHDPFTDRITLTRTESGNFNGKDSSDTNYGVNDREIIVNGDFAALMRFGSQSVESGGENAVFKINGLDTERNSNTFLMSGVTFTLKQTFAETGTGVGISINNDSNQVFENIKEFVEKYNELIDKVNDKVTETFYRDYKPLTDTQREQLTDKQQEQWEERAKSGLLKRDSILTGALSQMRMDFYGAVNNPDVSPLFNHLTNVGITTTVNYLEGGKLEINEAELKEAIETDPKSVENLFTGNGDTFGEKGIIQRLFDSVNVVMDKLDEKAGDSFSTNQDFAIGKKLNRLEDDIDRFEDRLTQIEDRYWRQFTAMEQAIQRANSQSMFMMQQFGGM